jgi:hypothetical protein
MSGRDPERPIRSHGRPHHFQVPSVNGALNSINIMISQPPKMTNGQGVPGLNPGASRFQPSSAEQNGTMNSQTRPQSSSPSDLKALLVRVENLEIEQDVMRNKVGSLRVDCSDLGHSVEEIKKGGWRVNVGPFQDQPANSGHNSTHSAADFKRKLEELQSEMEGITATGAIMSEIRNDENTMPSSNKGHSMPPHLRKTLKTQPVSPSTPATLPAGVSNPLVTDGKVDVPTVIQVRPTPPTTPPPSSPDTVMIYIPEKQTIEDPHVVHSGKNWMPVAISAFPNISSDTLANIPPPSETMTFSFDFLNNHLGGTFWSPGLKYLPPSSLDKSRILKDRSYYMIDAEYEPYLPREPGMHGAKLTAFFNQNPEDVWENVETPGNSIENVPMFVSASAFGSADGLSKKRYVYFGNYSQTRWSDKLDYDRMVDQVSLKVKEYWAEELSSNGRADWVTKALQNHFFPKPVYEGTVVTTNVEGSVAPEEEAKLEQEMEQDVKFWIRQLQFWEKDSVLKTKMIKKNFILDAFERVSTSPFLLWLVIVANPLIGRCGRAAGAASLVGVPPVRQLRPRFLRVPGQAAGPRGAIPELNNARLSRTLTRYDKHI